jgi:hypothetical protein
MNIGWATLGMVFLVALAAGVVVVVLFTLGVVALGKRSTPLGHRGSAIAATATAGACFLACAALILYGLDIIVSG